MIAMLYSALCWGVCSRTTLSLNYYSMIVARYFPISKLIADRTGSFARGQNARHLDMLRRFRNLTGSHSIVHRLAAKQGRVPDLKGDVKGARGREEARFEVACRAILDMQLG
ncbi:hypothetical protein F5B20DRAFT_551373 [Whalleya microplaca]|nr:hypothetical protein F5B20DRAFT_551373 [Whalleya microplaca]